MKRSPLASKTPMRRTAFKRQRGPTRNQQLNHRIKIEQCDDPNDPEVVFREDVHRRSGGICELCRKRRAVQIHHRRTRTVKWSKWLAVNGLDLCRACHHDVIHAHTDWAMRHMLILSRHSTTHPLPVTTCGLDCDVDHRS
jgi:hypothetical protein